jgi:hypothetical protein
VEVVIGGMQSRAVGDEFITAQLVRPKADAFMPVKRLMVAVLTVALGDYQTHAAATDLWGKRRFAAIEAWFMSADSRWPFSFVGICEALGLDAPSIRVVIRRRSRLHNGVSQ